MGIQINGATDSITAIDGTIDVVSAIGNAGVVTATAFVGNITGNVTGNINHTSNLELQVGGVTRGNFDSSGRLLIGTSTEGHVSADDLTIATSGNTGMTIRSGTSSFGSLFFSDATSGSDELAGAIEYNHNGDYMQFRTGAYERLRITSSGSVGIGSVTPGGVLDLYHASNNTILNVKSGDAGSVINLIDSATRSSIEQNGVSLKIISDTSGTYANSDIRLQVDGSTKMLVDNGGKIGIGTVSPATMHHLYSESGGLYTRFEAPAGQVNFGNSNGIGVIHVTSTSQPLKVLVNGSNERLRITSAGSVNIGGDYTQTSQKLKVTGNTTIDGTLTAGVGFVCAGGYSIFSGNVTQQGYTFHDADSDTYFGFPSNDQFAIFTAGTQRLKIFSNGNSDFDVAGGTLKVTGTGAYGLSIHNTNSPSMGHLFIYGDNGLIRFRNSSNNYTAQMGYSESTNSLFLYNQEEGTTLDIINDGVRIGDNKKFLCGNDSDLQIYHNNSNAFIKNGTGQLLFRSNDHTFENAAGSVEKLRITSQGSVFVKSASTVPVNQAESGHYSSTGYNAGHALGLMVKRSICVSDADTKGVGGIFLSHTRNVACDGTTYNMMTLMNREGTFVGDVYIGFSAGGAGVVRHYKFTCLYNGNTLTSIDNASRAGKSETISANISTSGDSHFFQVIPNMSTNETCRVSMTIVGAACGRNDGAGNDYYTVNYN